MKYFDYFRPARPECRTWEEESEISPRASAARAVANQRSRGEMLKEFTNCVGLYSFRWYADLTAISCDGVGGAVRRFRKWIEWLERQSGSEVGWVLAVESGSLAGHGRQGYSVRLHALVAFRGRLMRAAAEERWRRKWGEARVSVIEPPHGDAFFWNGVAISAYRMYGASPDLRLFRPKLDSH